MTRSEGGHTTAMAVSVSVVSMSGGSQGVVKTFSTVIGGIGLLALGSDLVILLGFNQPRNPVIMALSLALFLGCAAIRRLTRTNEVKARRFLLLLITLILMAFIVTAPPTLVISVSYFVLPVAAAVCGALELEVGTTTAVGGLLAVVAYVKTTPAPRLGDFTELRDWLALMTIYLILSFGVGLFVHRTRRYNEQMQAQQAELVRLLDAKTKTGVVGQNLSHNLSAMTANLKISANQQASQTQELTATVTQVTVSLEELSDAALQIAGSAQAAAKLAYQTLDLAGQVKGNSVSAHDASQKGVQAVTNSTQTVERMRSRIELLGQHLLALTAQQRQVGRVLDIIQDLADETRLLALNASIEAAGSAASTNGHAASRGERFGVIAQEVKNLAERSQDAVEEVRQVITEMQGAVAAAVLVAEETKKEAAWARTGTHIMGTVIDELNAVIEDSTASAEQIVSAAQEVTMRCNEIRIATSQQGSASQQVLASMQQTTAQSQEKVLAIRFLTDMATQIETNTNQLNLILTAS